MPVKIFHSDPQHEYWFHEGCHILEVSNSEDDPDISIARARVSPGTRTCWHMLDGISERYLLVAGKGRVEVGKSAAAEVSAGDMVLIPANTRQRIENIGDQDLVFYAICSPRFNPALYIRIQDN